MDLSNIKINITADTEQAEKGIKSLKEQGKSLEDLGGSLTKGVTLPIMAIGTACLMSASDASEMESKFNTVFKNLSNDADTWATTYADSIGRSKYEIKTAISNQADLYQGMGFTADEAYNLSKQVTTLGYDLASFNNVNDSQAVDAMTKALMGETESAKMLGVNLTDRIMETSEFTKATGKSWKELSMAEKANVRYKEAVKQSKNAIGDAEKTSDSFANQLKRMKGNFQEIAVVIGKQILPVVEPLIQWLNKGLKAVMNFITENEKLTQGIVIIGGVLASIGPLIWMVGKLITMFTALNPVTLGVIGAIGALGGAFLLLNDEFMANIPNMINEFIMGLNTMLQKIVEVLPQFIEKGIEIIFKLIEGLSLALPQFLQYGVDMFMNLMGTLFTFMPKFLQMGFDIIQNLIQGCINNFPIFIDNIVNGIISTIEHIKAYMPEFLENGIEFIKNMVKGFKDNIPQMLDKVGELIVLMLNKLFEAIPKLIKSGWELLKSIISGLWDNRSELANIGKDLIDTLIDSILSIGSSLINIGKTIVDNILSGIKGAWSSLTGWVSSKLEDIPIIGGLFKSVEPPNGLQGGAVESGLLATGGGMAMLSKSPLSSMLDMPVKYGATPKRSNTRSKGEELIGAVKDGINTVQNITINSPKHLSPYETAQEFKKINRELALSF